MSDIIVFQEYVNATIEFIKKYKRFPFLSGDQVIINDSPYSADKYAKEFFGNKDKMIEHFLDNKIITYKFISECTGINEGRVSELVKKEAKQIDKNQRRKLHIFFEKDLYKDEGEYYALCEKCKRKCKQEYWAIFLECPKHEGKDKKKSKT